MSYLFLEHWGRFSNICKLTPDKKTAFISYRSKLITSSQSEKRIPIAFFVFIGAVSLMLRALPLRILTDKNKSILLKIQKTREPKSDSLAANYNYFPTLALSKSGFRSELCPSQPIKAPYSIYFLKIISQCEKYVKGFCRKKAGTI